MELLRRVFKRSNVVRASGVAVLGVVLSLLAWLERNGAREAHGPGDGAVGTWQDWMEVGVLVTALALLFVAVGLLLGLPDGAREPEPTTRPADHWS